MRFRKTGLRSWLLPAFFAVGWANAATLSLDDLPLTPTTAADGSTRYQLAAGVYQGNVVIDRPVHLVCDPDAVLDAGGEGNALLIRVPQVTIENCTVRNWGRDMTAMHAGVFIEKQAANTTLKHSTLSGPGFGIWVDSAPDVLISDNTITGDANVRSQDRGNGIHLFKVTGARIVGNHVRETRDGIYIDVSNNNRIENNLFEDLRYGVHYMYSNHNTVSGNLTRRTRTGYALMQSHHLTVFDNRSEDDQNYGILMNYITYSDIHDNVVTGVRSGATGGDTMISGAEGKALFIYNSVFNRIEHNRFENSMLGIHLTAGSEDNVIRNNAFIANQQQVKYVAVRTQEWSTDGRGNYWSDYLGWDRDNNGIGDVSYEPNDQVDRLVWKYPQVRVLMNSPAIEMLRWVQRAFPVVRPAGVKDSFPLMRPATTAISTVQGVGP